MKRTDGQTDGQGKHIQQKSKTASRAETPFTQLVLNITDREATDFSQQYRTATAHTTRRSWSTSHPSHHHLCVWLLHAPHSPSRGIAWHERATVASPDHHRHSSTDLICPEIPPADDRSKGVPSDGIGKIKNGWNGKGPVSTHTCATAFPVFASRFVLDRRGSGENFTCLREIAICAGQAGPAQSGL